MAKKGGQQLTKSMLKQLEPAPLLATKLYIPPLRDKIVERPYLSQKLRAGVDRPGCFTLVSGPAGFGKTTLLSEFVTQRKAPTAWLSLDEGDNNPTRFWTYLVMACQTVLTELGQSVLELLSTPQQLPDETIPTLLINDLAAQDRSLVLVLDDYHEIQNTSIHASLQFLLDHLTPNFHLIVSSRIDPPWLLTRFRARNQLIEIRTQDLRFRGAEAAEFLNQTMGLDLSDTDVAALEARTEGWIAGLQLAALSLQNRSDTAVFIQAFTGSNVYIAEYLLEEILLKQPKAVQLFLLQTSILERMNAELCTAVTANQNSQTILTDLHRANIFIVPLDNEAHWFRYHHLFADLLHAHLRQKLTAEAIAELQLRAADWYEQNGFEVEAVRHTLAAQDFERAAALVDQFGQKMIFTDHSRLNNWLNALPNAAFQTYPRLEIYRVLIELSQGTLDMQEQTLQEKEQLINALPPSPANDRLRLEAMVYLSLFLAHQNTTRAIQIAQETLTELPEENLRLQAFLYSALYRAYGMEGDIAKSAPAYEECFRLAQAAGQIGMVSVTTMVRAFDLCQYGRLDEAARYCQAILDAAPKDKRTTFYQAGPSHIGLAGIHLERNELAAAEEHLTHGLELCRQSGMDGLYTGYLQMARLRQAKGDAAGAMEDLRLLQQTFQRWDFTLTARQVSARLALGDVESASQLVKSLLAIFGDSAYAQKLPLIAVEAFNLSLARIYIAQGKIEQANNLLDEIERTAVPGQRDGRLLEIHLLRALALQKQNEGHIAAAALAYMERALKLAEPAGFVLLFLEEGEALVALLTAVTNQPTSSTQAKNYARQLLTAFEGISKPTPSESDELFEQLTPREMEVLALLVAGDSNKTIADKLFITVRTVKKHITNILGKLGVSNRTQAAARARELGLIHVD